MAAAARRSRDGLRFERCGRRKRRLILLYILINGSAYFYPRRCFCKSEERRHRRPVTCVRAWDIWRACTTRSE
jgi:hypothetical protein